jgi:membrane associated rhomboid family serine protease
VLNLLLGWVFMWAFYIVLMRGRSTPDPARAAGFDYRHRVSDRFGLLPPSREPVGIILWALTGFGFLAGLAFFLVDGDFIGVASGTMVSSFLLTLWRDNQWLKQQPDYLDAIDAASAADSADHDNDDLD